MMLLEGFVQEAQHNFDSTRLYFKIVEDADETSADGDVSITIRKPSSQLGDGDVITASASMTSLTSGSATYYYDLDTTGTASYTIAEGYEAQINYYVSSNARQAYMYFDVVKYPIGGPIVSTEIIDVKHPDWKRDHPSGSTGTWVEAIEHAHVEVCRRIRSAGDRARRIIKREELWPYELAFAEAECAERLMRLPVDERVFWRKRANDLWSSRGEFDLYDDDGYEEPSKAIGVTRMVR